MDVWSALKIWTKLNGNFRFWRTHWTIPMGRKYGHRRPLADCTMRSHIVVQQNVRTPTVPSFASCCIPGTHGQVFGLAFTRRLSVRAPTTDARLKKRIVRTVIQEVVADIDAAAAEIILLVHWVGGVHSETRLPRRRRGQRTSTAADVIVAVRQLTVIASDDLIAGILNRNGLLSSYGNRWTRERVTSLRSHYRIPVHKPAEDGIEPWLNLSDAAQLLHVAPKTIRLAAEAGEIEAVHPLPDGPWIFSRAVLATSSANAITERARRNLKHPAGSHPDQQNLFSSIT